MFASVHGPDDRCWHILFAWWMYENGLECLGHDLPGMMHPLQAPQGPVDGLALGRFGKHAQDRNDTSRVVPLSMVLLAAAGTVHLACESVPTN